MSRSARRRIVAAALAVVAIVAGLAVHAGPASAATDVAGDALYAALVYLLVVLLAPRWSVWGAGAVAAAWCVAVELLQLTGLPAVWSAAAPPVRLVLGTGFDVRDILVYAVTAVVCAGLDAGIRRFASCPR
ncbi:DUF2809 domain-containing protein [Microbacterium sp. SORGH_AS_0888]|uniref:DUF2809 domain-containing protein n=1 Tax=Microbacterium sp. SORGH_AS_0888 TaxID=3041791 RepID=UPI002785F3E2|nr:DUF2809 domain-containing protein [Microbacterium sp. SORGH_AS_0888]MDQ1129010.1 hypothetical protein [Microbacterium sp. SORGH_AS_0888]